MAVSVSIIVALVLLSTTAGAQGQDSSELSLGYYSVSCPTAQDIVRAEMECAVRADTRKAASILRLHFHDCFVKGCDGSVLLDDTYSIKGEKQATQNANSLIGFELIDRIKNRIESECPGVVSCADLLAIAARDAVLLVGGPYWDVPVGRKDSTKASQEEANTDIPTPEEGLLSLVASFIGKGLSVTDFVALIGAHTIGMARCVNFRERIYGDFPMTSHSYPVSDSYLSKLRSTCPVDGDNNNISAMDYVTPTLFDNAFYQILLRGEGLLNSDQEMYSSLVGYETAGIVAKYAAEPIAFFNQFSESMVKLGNITNPEGGEVRKNCRYVNT